MLSWNARGTGKHMAPTFMCPCPAAVYDMAPTLWREWLKLRRTARFFDEPVMKQGWMVYRFQNAAVEIDNESLSTMWHGTCPMGLWNTAFYGVLLPTQDADKGHRVNQKGGANGVWLTSLLEDALRYSIPTTMFADHVYYRAIWKCSVDATEAIGSADSEFDVEHKSYMPDRVRLEELWILPNAPPNNDEACITVWEPLMEVLPSPVVAPQPNLINKKQLMIFPMKAPKNGPYPLFRSDPQSWWVLIPLEEKCSRDEERSRRAQVPPGIERLNIRYEGDSADFVGAVPGEQASEAGKITGVTILADDMVVIDPDESTPAEVMADAKPTVIFKTPPPSMPPHPRRATSVPSTLVSPTPRPPPPPRPTPRVDEAERAEVDEGDAR